MTHVHEVHRVWISAFLLFSALAGCPVQCQEPLDLGSLSLAQRKKLLERYDENGDGKLEGDECRAARRSIERQKRWRKKFSRLAARRGPGFQKAKVAAKFDVDGNHWLNRAERDRARKWLKENPRTRRGPGGRMGFPGGSRRRRGEQSGTPESAGPDRAIHPGDVPTHPGRELYDPSILRTLFLDFPAKDWEQELNDFYRTDVDVPATLTVDGKKLEGVGVRFRGNTSIMMVPQGRKKSLNLDVNLVHGKQRLYGYRTLNLLNAHTDPSFLREMIYSRICRDYLPAPKANFVRLVINGENWGVYVNLQQINKDFLKEWYGTRKGIRWKVPPDFSGGGALKYFGDDESLYKARYALKTGKGDRGWPHLVTLCKVLDQTPVKQLESRLPEILDVDQTLWFLALDNVFMDDDGYFSRGSDYVLYKDRKDRFHLITHDNNETFRFGGRGPGGPGGPGGFPGGFGDEPPPPDDRPGSGRSGTQLSPVQYEDSASRPLIRCLLSVPAWRARYLAHVRTIVVEWLDWEVLGPICREYHAMLDQEIRSDRKKLCTYEDFRNSLEQDTSGGPRRTPSLKRFVEERRAFLLAHPALKGPWPRISSVTHQAEAGEGGVLRLRIRALAEGEAPPGKVLLHYRSRRRGPFVPVVMHDDGRHGDTGAGDGVYEAVTPCFPRGTRLHYYVEVRAAPEVGTAAFHPPRSEGGAIECRLGRN